MKKILVFVLIWIFFMSCENGYVRDGRSLYKAYFKKTLIDPSSFKVYNESYEINGASVKWKLDYGAKNSYGGMIRKTEEFETIGSITIIIDGRFLDFDDIKKLNHK